MLTPRYGILLAAFGAGSAQGESTLRGFENLVRERWPQVPVRWAFTSTALRARLAEARKKADSVEKALRRMAFERFTHVAVQPLHLIAGLEYGDIVHEATRLVQEGLFAGLRVGCPLLDDSCRPDAMEKVTRALLAGIPAEREADDPVLFMGHGSRHAAESWYAELDRRAASLDPRVFVGTMSGTTRLEQLLPRLTAAPSRRVWLLPLLAVVGRHALNDMAGDDPTSWRSRLEAAGFDCHPILRGLVEQEACARLWADCLGRAMDELRAGVPDAAARS